PQKNLGAGAGRPLSAGPQRLSFSLAVSGPLLGAPLFGAPPLAGAAVFVEGRPRRPDIKHDHGFLDDGKGNIDPSKRQSPTERDLASKEIWGKVILGGALK